MRCFVCWIGTQGVVDRWRIGIFETQDVCRLPGWSHGLYAYPPVNALRWAGVRSQAHNGAIAPVVRVFSIANAELPRERKGTRRRKGPTVLGSWQTAFGVRGPGRIVRCRASPETFLKPTCLWVAIPSLVTELKRDCAVSFKGTSNPSIPRLEWISDGSI
jgi:hypothetical protein